MHDRDRHPRVARDRVQRRGIPTSCTPTRFVRPEKPLEPQFIRFLRMRRSDLLQHRACRIASVPAIDHRAPALFRFFAVFNWFPRRSKKHLVARAGNETKLLLEMVALLPVEPQAHEIIREPPVNFWLREHPALFKLEAGSEDSRAIIVSDLRVCAAVANQ